MSAGRSIVRIGGRVGISVLLLFWIFNVIFLHEARGVAPSLGLDWEALSRWEQWGHAWRLGPPELWGTLTLIPPWPLGWSVLLMGGTILLGVVRWRMVLQAQGLKLSAGRALEISCVAHFFNSFLLGSTGGDLMKAYYAARETHHQKTEAVVTVFVDRLVGLWAMLLFGSVMILPNHALVLGSHRLRTLSFLVLCMLAACTLLVVLAFWGGVSRGWSGARAWLRRLPKGEWLDRSLNSCRQFGRARGFLTRTMAVSMVLNAVCVAQVMVLSRGLNLPVPLTAYLAIVPMIICVAAMPITPSGLGVRENLFVLMLAVPGLQVEATAALSLSLLTYAGSLFWSLVGGLVYLTLKDRHQLAEVQQETPAPPEAGSTGGGPSHPTPPHHA